MSEGFYGHAFIAPKRVIYAIFFFCSSSRLLWSLLSISVIAERERENKRIEKGVSSCAWF